MENFTVYMHIFPNDKVYIGVTGKNPPELRWGENGSGYTNRNIKSAIKHYGWENVQHFILADNLSEDWAYAMEIDLIARYNSTDRNYGYNSSKGGKINKGYKVGHTDEWRKNMSEKMLEWHKNHPEFKDLIRSINCGRVCSEETRKKLSESHKGHVSGMKGRHHTEESRAKMRASHQAHPNVISDWQKQRISEASKGRHLTDEQKQHLREAQLGKKLTDEHRQKLSEAKKGKPSNRKGKHLSEETKEKLRKANIGKKLDDVTRQKMSEAQKKRWSKK